MATGQLYIGTRVIKFINKLVRLILISGLGISCKTCSSSTVFIFFSTVTEFELQCSFKRRKSKRFTYIWSCINKSFFFFFLWYPVALFAQHGFVVHACVIFAYLNVKMSWASSVERLSFFPAYLWLEELFFSLGEQWVVYEKLCLLFGDLFAPHCLLYDVISFLIASLFCTNLRGTLYWDSKR